MIHELIYTSAEKGLQPGRGGFCTVATTAGIPRKLVQALESLSVYRHAADNSAGGGRHPEVYSFLKLQLGSDRYAVLSRLADAGFDHTGRSNYLAHHVAIEAGDQVPQSPAALMARSDFFVSSWQGEPRILDSTRRLPKGHPQPAICQQWQQVAGDAGWAGALAQSLLDDGRPVTLIVRPDMPVLALLAEAAGLLDDRWQPTFTSYFTQLPPGVNCAWRCVWQGSPEAAAAERGGQLVWNLCRNLGTPPDGPLTAAARSGARSAPPPFSRPSRDPSRDWDDQPVAREPTRTLPATRPMPVEPPTWRAPPASPAVFQASDGQPLPPPATEDDHGEQDIALSPLPEMSRRSRAVFYRARDARQSSLRPLLWASLAVLLLCLAGVGGAAYWKWNRDQERQAATNSEKQPDQTGPAAHAANLKPPARRPGGDEFVAAPPQPRRDPASTRNTANSNRHQPPSTARPKEELEGWITQAREIVARYSHNQSDIEAAIDKTYGQLKSDHEKYRFLMEIKQDSTHQRLQKILTLDPSEIGSHKELPRLWRQVQQLTDKFDKLCSDFADTWRPWDPSDPVRVPIPHNRDQNNFLPMNSYSSEEMQIECRCGEREPVVVRRRDPTTNRWSVFAKGGQSEGASELMEISFSVSQERAQWSFQRVSTSDVTLPQFTLTLNTSRPFSDSRDERLVTFQPPPPIHVDVNFAQIALIRIPLPLSELAPGQMLELGLGARAPREIAERFTFTAADFAKFESNDTSPNPETAKPDFLMGTTANGTQVLLRSKTAQNKDRREIQYALVHGQTCEPFDVTFSRETVNISQPNVAGEPKNDAIPAARNEVFRKLPQPAKEANSDKINAELDHRQKRLLEIDLSQYALVNDVISASDGRIKKLIEGEKLSEELEKALKGLNKAIFEFAKAEKARLIEVEAAKLRQTLERFHTNPHVRIWLVVSEQEEYERKVELRVVAVEDAAKQDVVPPDTTDPFSENFQPPEPKRGKRPEGKPALPKPDQPPAAPPAPSPGVLSQPGLKEL